MQNSARFLKYRSVRWSQRRDTVDRPAALSLKRGHPFVKRDIAHRKQEDAALSRKESAQISYEVDRSGRVGLSRVLAKSSVAAAFLRSDSTGVSVESEERFAVLAIVWSV